MLLVAGRLVRTRRAVQCGIGRNWAELGGGIGPPGEGPPQRFTERTRAKHRASCFAMEVLGIRTRMNLAKPVGPLILRPSPLMRSINKSIARTSSPSDCLSQSSCWARPTNVNGVPSQSPGLRRQALPWVTDPVVASTPTGLRHHRGSVGAGDGTPLGFDGIGDGLPRVGAPTARQLWAGGRNAVGVRRVGCRASATDPEPAASHEPPSASRIRHARILGRWIRGGRALTAAVGERNRSAERKPA